MTSVSTCRRDRKYDSNFTSTEYWHSPVASRQKAINYSGNLLESSITHKTNIYIIICTIWTKKRQTSKFIHASNDYYRYLYSFTSKRSWSIYPFHIICFHMKKITSIGRCNKKHRNDRWNEYWWGMGIGNLLNTRRCNSYFGCYKF